MFVTLKENGKLRLPAEVMLDLGLEENDELEVSVERGSIVLRPRGSLVDALEREAIAEGKHIPVPRLHLVDNPTLVDLDHRD